MDNDSSQAGQEWFMDVGGKKTGPFTADQVLGFLADGEILAETRVTSEALDGVWITAFELSQKLHSIPRPSRPFTPPPRPVDLTPPPSAHSSIEIPPAVPNDPAVGLFDALQAAKERKQHHQSSQTTPQNQGQNPAPSFSGTRPDLMGISWEDRIKGLPQKAWLLAGVALLLALSVWGMVYFIKGRTPPAPESSPASSVAPANPPPAHDTQAPPAPPGHVTPGAIHLPPPGNAPPSHPTPPPAANSGGGAAYGYEDEESNVPPPALPEPPLHEAIPPPPPAETPSPPQGGDPTQGGPPDPNAPQQFPPPPAPIE